MNRVSVLVDGFNLYHSLADAGPRVGKGVKWLDLWGLISSYPQVIGGRPVIGELRYFSALAHHRIPHDAGVTQRHRAYIAALEISGVRIQLGRFKASRQTCKICRSSYRRYEEKETDVALAVGVMEALLNPQIDTVVLVSGDSDLAPALRVARTRFPEKRLGVAFPFRRVSEELKRESDFHWKLRPERYQAFQFPNQVLGKHGAIVKKPVSW